MTPKFLIEIQSDLTAAVAALDAGDTFTARCQLGSLSAFVDSMLAESQSPYATKKQGWFLGRLCGASVASIDLDTVIKSDASAAISELLAYGQTEIQGHTLYRITTDKQEKNRKLKRKLQGKAA